MNNIELADKLCSFIRDLGEDLCSLQLLLFFSRHPHARFNRTAVLHAPISASQFDVAISLKHLIDKRIVVTYSENGITLYALTKEEPLHSLAEELINVDQQQWQIIIEQILNVNGIQ